jgi:hypothetical protein
MKREDHINEDIPIIFSHLISIMISNIKELNDLDDMFVITTNITYLKNLILYYEKKKPDCKININF